MVPSCKDAFLSFELNVLSLLSLVPFKVTPQLAEVIRLTEQVSGQGMQHLFPLQFSLPQTCPPSPITFILPLTYATLLPLSPPPLISDFLQLFVAMQQRMQQHEQVCTARGHHGQLIPHSYVGGSWGHLH